MSAITRTSEGPAGMSMETIASLFCSSILAAVTYWLPGPSSLSTCVLHACAQNALIPLIRLCVAASGHVDEDHGLAVLQQHTGRKPSSLSSCAWHACLEIAVISSVQLGARLPPCTSCESPHRPSQLVRICARHARAICCAKKSLPHSFRAQQRVHSRTPHAACGEGREGVGLHLGAGLSSPSHGRHRLSAAGLEHVRHARLLCAVQHLWRHLQCDINFRAGPGPCAALFRSTYGRQIAWRSGKKQSFVRLYITCMQPGRVL